MTHESFQPDVAGACRQLQDHLNLVYKRLKLLLLLFFHLPVNHFMIIFNHLLALWLELCCYSDPYIYFPVLVALASYGFYPSKSCFQCAYCT